MTTITKAVRLEVKDAAKGTVKAVFSRLVPSLEAATEADIDADGDVTVKGAFTNGARVVMSAYGHESWKGALPIGHGTISEVGNEAIFDGQFLLNTDHGRNAFETVKALSEVDLQEWSYSLHDVKSTPATVAGRKVRGLLGITVKEVSPVLKGAGVDTTTLEIKSKDNEPETKQLQSSIACLLSAAGRDRWQVRYSTWTWLEDYDVDAGFAVYGIEDDGCRLVQVSFERTDTSVTLGAEETEVHETAVYLPKRDREGARMKFSEHLASVLADVKALTTRASDVVALRAEKGKGMSPATVDLLKQVAAAVDDLVDTVDTPDTPPTPPSGDETTSVVDEDQAAIAAELNALELDVIATDLEGEEA